MFTVILPPFFVYFYLKAILRIEHGGLGGNAMLSLRSFKYVLANMNYVCNISIKSQLRIDTGDQRAL